MLARKLRKFWRNYSLRDTEELVPSGNTGESRAVRDAELTVFDPQDPRFVDDPYPLFAYLRNQEPIQRAVSGAWVLSRYDDISKALIDDRLGNSPSEYATVNRRNQERYLCARVANNILPFMDPPAHTAPRKLITQSFHQYLKKNPPSMSRIAREILEHLSQEQELDLMQDFATPYAARVFCELLGLDQRQLPQLMEWSHWFFYLLTVIPSQHARAQIDHALEQIRACFQELVESRKTDPAADYVSCLLSIDDRESRLSDEQLVDNLILLFADGVGNVDKGICATAALLLQHPDQLALLKKQSELMPQAIDESLRFESPAQFIGRVARQDMEINGQAIRQNEAVVLLLGSANRDPAQFENPDQFDIRRYPNPHLSFGRSRHACVGGPLVRQEILVALECLFEYWPNMSLLSQKLVWQQRMGHRWLAELKVKPG